MDGKHRCIQIFGWLSVIAGYGFALLLLRGIFIGITRGFAGRPQVFWLVLGYLLFLAAATYLFTCRTVAQYRSRREPSTKGAVRMGENAAGGRAHLRSCGLWPVLSRCYANNLVRSRQWHGSLTCQFRSRKIRASDRPYNLALPHCREVGRRRDGRGLQS